MPITINNCVRCGANPQMDNTEVVFQIWCACNPDYNKLASKVNAGLLVVHYEVAKAIDRWNRLNPTEKTDADNNQ